MKSFLEYIQSVNENAENHIFYIMYPQKCKGHTISIDEIPSKKIDDERDGRRKCIWYDGENYGFGDNGNNSVETNIKSGDPEDGDYIISDIQFKHGHHKWFPKDKGGSKFYHCILVMRPEGVRTYGNPYNECGVFISDDTNEGDIIVGTKKQFADYVGSHGQEINKKWPNIDIEALTKKIETLK